MARGDAYTALRLQREHVASQHIAIVNQICIQQAANGADRSAVNAKKLRAYGSC